jgi:hypothetical protein
VYIVFAILEKVSRKMHRKTEIVIASGKKQNSLSG